MADIITKNCKIHGETSFAFRKSSNRYKCKRCGIDAVIKRRKKLKQLAIEKRGGACEHCGIKSQYQAIYDFHHLDPTTKEFALSSKGITKSWKKVEEELKKCILLCANCHRIVHAKIEEQKI